MNQFNDITSKTFIQRIQTVKHYIKFHHHAIAQVARH